MLEKNECVIPVIKFDFPPLRGFEISTSKLEYKWPEFEKVRSQDLGELYHDAGQWYFFRNTKCKHVSILKEITAPLILERERVQDIDTESDWKIAEIKYELFG